MPNTPTSLKETKKNAKASIEHMDMTAREKIKNTIDNAKDYSLRAQEMASRAGKESVVFVRKHPINSTLVAAFLGLFAGILLGRRRK